MTFEAAFEAAWKYGTPIVLLFVGGYYLIQGARVFWRDVVLHVRDQFIIRAVAFLTKQEISLDTILRRHDDSAHRDELAGEERVRHEDLLYHIKDKLDEMVEICARVETHITGSPPPPRRLSQRQRRQRGTGTVTTQEVAPPTGPSAPPSSSPSA